MLFPDLLGELRELKLPIGEYAVYGSGPLAVRGLRHSDDIDILVTKKLWSQLPGVQVTPTLKRIGNIDVSAEWGGIIDDPEECIRRAELIRGVPFLTLQDTVAWKTRRGRQKDLQDIAIIQEHLKNYK